MFIDAEIKPSTSVENGKVKMLVENFAKGLFSYFTYGWAVCNVEIGTSYTHLNKEEHIAVAGPRIAAKPRAAIRIVKRTVASSSAST